MKLFTAFALAAASAGLVMSPVALADHHKKGDKKCDCADGKKCKCKDKDCDCKKDDHAEKKEEAKH